MSITYETLLGLTRDNSLFEYAKHVVHWNDVARKARGGNHTDRDLQWSFVQEEFDETVEALRQGNRVEVVDGACDLFVVASYALYLDKIRSSSTDRQALGELCSPCRFDEETHFSLIDLERSIYEDKNRFSTLAQVVALIYRLDISISYNLGEVLASNDTKYPTIAELREHHPGKELVEALEQECRDIEDRNQGRYKGVNFSRVDERVVFFDETGKIMKPVTFRKPKIIA